MRYTKEQVVAAVRTMDFSSLRHADDGVYRTSVTCEDRLPHTGETYCTNEATFKHKDADGEYIPVCEEHRCKRCKPMKRKPS